MKKFFVMLALAWGTVGAFAQNEADSVAAVNNAITLAKDVYPQKEEDGDLYHGLTRKLTFDRMIPPYGLEVTYGKTTHIIFPSSVRYVDLGSPNLIAGKADGAENVIRVKTTVKDFREETNMSVITESGSFYTFNVKYAEEPLLLNIGRIAKEKNLEQVMRVFPKLLNACPDVHFAIVGEGPMREDLGRMAEELGVSRAVTLTGPKPWEKIDRYYAMGDVFCSASHSETQGLTYVEAMASGLCVCAVNDPCLDGVVEDGVSGILAGDSDESLLAALIRAFGEEGKRIAKTAAQYAAPFSTEGFAEKVEACYLKAIEAGVDIIDCAISPFAMGTSQPPTEPIVAALAGTEYDLSLIHI